MDNVQKYNSFNTCNYYYYVKHQSKYLI